MDFPTNEVKEVTMQDAKGSSESFAYSPDVLLKVYWLQKRNNFLMAVEDYQKRKIWGSRAPTVFVYSRLYSLWLDLKPALKRRWKDKEAVKNFNKLEKLLEDRKNFQKMMQAFDMINEWLDNIGITRVDTRIKYNAKNAEDANKNRGY